MKHFVVNLYGFADPSPRAEEIAAIAGPYLSIGIDINTPDFNVIEEIDKPRLDDDIIVYVNHDYADGSLLVWDNVRTVLKRLEYVLHTMVDEGRIQTYEIKHVVDGQVAKLVRSYKATIIDAGDYSTAIQVENIMRPQEGAPTVYSIIQDTLANAIAPYTKPRFMVFDGVTGLEMIDDIAIRFASGGEINKVSTIQHYLNQLAPLAEPCTWKRDEDRKLRTLANRLSGLLRNADPMKASCHYYSVTHVVWMLNEIRYNETMTHNDKHRWIGWIQCLLDVVYDLTNVDNERNSTRAIIKGS